MPATTRSGTKRKATAVAAAVLCQEPLVLTVLSYVDTASLAPAAAVGKLFQEAASSDVIWADRLLAAYPSSGPLLEIMQARGDPVKAFYRRRFLEETSYPPTKPKPEVEEQRLRRALANTYVELQVTHDGSGTPLASLLIPATDDERMMALFSRKWMPLTMEHAEKPEGIEGDGDSTVYVTILQTAPQQQSLLVAGTEDWFTTKEEEVEGALVSIYDFFGGCKLQYPSSSKIDISYSSCLVLRRTLHDTGAWKMELRVEVDVMDESEITGMKFESMFDVLRFIEFLLKYQRLWNEPKLEGEE